LKIGERVMQTLDQLSFGDLNGAYQAMAAKEWERLGHLILQERKDIF
jgi:hypothetical protein